ncbi:ACT domain-containing protein [Maribellus mangrovi]|uniref:ACT domain-containing protein n=1 Tax=Maribellus mangrovi TaxID=3133146 RepID=UPI0030EECA99
MSDKVIRVGGSHIGDKTSLINLTEYLSANKNGRNFVVLSAVPQLINILEVHLSTVLDKRIENADIKEQLIEVYKNYLDCDITPEYLELADQTANLLRGIALIGDYSTALKDQVLTYAERLSVELLKARWQKAKVLLPEDFRLMATGDFGNATLIGIDHSTINDLAVGTYIVPGTYGITEAGKISRSGRLAADYSAAFLTRELGAEKLELWDLDHDFLRADPAIISDLPKLQRLTYEEASELAYFDHYSFHPRTVEPLEHEHIPIVILNSESGAGTIETTINTETFVEEQIVKSVACTDDISLLKLDGPGVGLKPGILARVTNQLNEAGLNIKSVITSQTSINFILSKENGDKAIKLIHDLVFSSVTDISVIKDISLIGVVGHGMQHAYGVSAKIFTAVANNKINVVLSGSGASDLVSYLIVSKSDKEKSVREIYKAFFK